MPQNLLPARTGRQFFGNLCHQSDRIRHHRSSDTDDSYGIQERPYHRHQSGHHRIRLFPVPLFSRRNDAARVIGRFCTGYGNAGRQRHRHHRRYTGRLESRQRPAGSHDRHRAADSHASSGGDTDSHHRFPTHLHVPRHRRRLHARSFYRTCRLPVAELGIGTDPCATDGRPPAASRHRFRPYRETRVQRQDLCHPPFGPTVRSGPPVELCICHGRPVAVFRLRLPIYASGLFPRHGLRPALYGIQTSGRKQLYTCGTGFGRNRNLSERTGGNNPRHHLHRRYARTLQPGTEHCQPVALVRRTDYRLHLAGNLGRAYRRNPNLPLPSLS